MNLRTNISYKNNHILILCWPKLIHIKLLIEGNTLILINKLYYNKYKLYSGVKLEVPEVTLIKMPLFLYDHQENLLLSEGDDGGWYASSKIEILIRCWRSPPQNIVATHDIIFVRAFPLPIGFPDALIKPVEPVFLFPIFRDGCR